MQYDNWQGPKRFLLNSGLSAGVGLLDWAFYINLCQLVFRCGCTYLWAGAAAHCNVHHGPKRCPVCQLPSGEYQLLLGSIVVVQVLLVWRGRPWLALGALPVLAIAQMLVLGWYRGYWS